MAELFLVPRPIELELESVDGESTADTVRGRERLTGRIAFGGPAISPVDANYHPEDAELQAYLKARSAQFRFVLAVMSVHFSFGEPQLSSAEVAVELDDDAGSSQTLAYSVFPARLDSATEATRGFSVNPNLTIAGVGGSIGDVTASTVVHGTDPYLIGGPALSARPVWSFRRIKGQDIVGPVQLIMITQVPIGAVGRLAVSLRATVEERSLFTRHQVPLDGADAAQPAIVTF